MTTTARSDHIKTSPIVSKPLVEKAKPATVIPDKTKVPISCILNQQKKSEEKPVAVSKSSGKGKKPKILTHVIEGFIIQEASEPFPVYIKLTLYFECWCYVCYVV